MLEMFWDKRRVGVSYRMLEMYGDKMHARSK